MNTNKKLQLERLNAVLNAIESNIEQFDMTYYEEIKSCGTVRCIAGWTIHIFLKRKFSLSFQEIDAMTAANILGLSVETANSLFYLQENPHFIWSYFSMDKNEENAAKEGLSRLKQLIARIESTSAENLVKTGICDYTNINVTDYA